MPVAMLCLKHSRVDQREKALCPYEIFSEAEKTDIGPMIPKIIDKLIQ